VKHQLATAGPDDVQAYRKRIQLVMETAEQVKKDFSLFDIDIQIGDDPELAYGRLIEQMSPVLEQFALNSPGLFSELMYRIDVDESRLQRLLADSHASSDIAFIHAEIIIEREFKKVLTRHLFKEGRLRD
jgi:hypothetical protein